MPIRHARIRESAQMSCSWRFQISFPRRQTVMERWFQTRQSLSVAAYGRVPCQLTVGNVDPDSDSIVRHVDARHAEMSIVLRSSCTEHQHVVDTVWADREETVNTLATHDSPRGQG
jgi:hypothetical protein